jgi:hypothetical protein
MRTRSSDNGKVGSRALFSEPWFAQIASSCRETDDNFDLSMRNRHDISI